MIKLLNLLIAAFKYYESKLLIKASKNYLFTEIFFKLNLLLFLINLIIFAPIFFINDFTNTIVLFGIFELFLTTVSLLYLKFKMKSIDVINKQIIKLSAQKENLGKIIKTNFQAISFLAFFLTLIFSIYAAFIYSILTLSSGSLIFKQFLYAVSIFFISLYFISFYVLSFNLISNSNNKSSYNKKIKTKQIKIITNHHQIIYIIFSVFSSLVLFSILKN